MPRRPRRRRRLRGWTHGFGFSSREVADAWLDHLPFTRTYTAERVAYRNLVLGLEPPATATYRNPYREWIGAQIRGDIWAYVSPGNPGQAARLAFRDAAVSHTANGIYGELWSAALIAAGFTVSDVASALATSLEYIPPRSRLAEALRHVLDLHAAGLEWQQARDQIEGGYGHYSWVHTIPNATVVAAALPPAWVEPFGDLVHSAIFGFDRSRISDLAERTLRLGLVGPRVAGTGFEPV